MERIRQLFQPYAMKSLRLPQPPAGSSQAGASNFIVMQAPTKITLDNSTIGGGEYSLQNVSGNMTITGSAPLDQKDAFVISNISGSGVLNLENVILMTGAISSDCKLTININNSQVIAETLTLDNVILNMTNSSIILYPRQETGILLRNSTLNASNSNFTLLTWLNLLSFIEANSSSLNVNSSEFVFIESLPTNNVALTWVISNVGSHTLENNKAYILAQKGSLQLYNITDTTLNISGLEIESTLNNVVPPLSTNSTASLINVTLNGKIVNQPSDLPRTLPFTASPGYTQPLTAQNGTTVVAAALIPVSGWQKYSSRRQEKWSSENSHEEKKEKKDRKHWHNRGKREHSRRQSKDWDKHHEDH